MKQTLSVRLGQQLAMTPQLQQAIRLMQLSSVELNLEVRQAVESNPMLELIEGYEDEAFEDDDQAFDERADSISDEDGDEFEGDDATLDADDSAGDFESFDDDGIGSQDGDPVADIPEELPVDVSWDDVYQPSAASVPSPSASDTDGGFEERDTMGETLHDHLLWQLNLTPMSDRDRLAAHVIIDSIDDDGMLTATIPEMLETVNPELGFEAGELAAVLTLVQSFDPPGVAARDIGECLSLQLEQLAEDTPWRRHAMRLLRDHLRLFAARNFPALARRMKLTDDELRQVMALIRSLNPRPGAAVGEASVEYVEPDVVVAKRDGRWVVELNHETAPRVRVNDDYACLVKRADNSRDNQYLKDNLQDAKWFLKNLAYRNETLLKVAAQIVERQRGFLEHGEEAMQPLVLADIAEAVDRHESTISRVTTRKYMDTPRGIFELKYFFSSHVGTASGGEVSSTAIRALIKKLIGAEDVRKPLSDNKIADYLKQRDIQVARRTVAKYRESMSIPPSNERKRLV